MEQDLANRLKTKVEELLSRYESLSLENAGLREALAKSESDNHKKEQRVKELEKQIDSLRLKDAFLGTAADRTKAKKKVARLIKEIDACVSLLND
jgi:regulator of replication initiation timing